MSSHQNRVGLVPCSNKNKWKWQLSYSAFSGRGYIFHQDTLVISWNPTLMLKVDLSYFNTETPQIKNCMCFLLIYWKFFNLPAALPSSEIKTNCNWKSFLHFKIWLKQWNYCYLSPFETCVRLRKVVMKWGFHKTFFIFLRLLIFYKTFSLSSI